MLRFFLLLCLPMPLHCQQVDWLAHDFNAIKTRFEVIDLLAGERDFHAVFHPFSAAKERGTIIVVPDFTEQLTASQYTLVQQLSQAGYNSYLMTVPAIEQVAAQKSATQQANDSHHFAVPTPPLNETTLTQHKDKLYLQINALYKKAQEHNQPIAVVLQGINGALLLEHLATLTDADEKPAALITHSLYLPNQARHQHIASHLAQVLSPVLDIYSESEHPWSKQQRNKRQRQALKGHKLNYRQQQLFASLEQPLQQQRLCKMIDGFLRRFF